MMGQETALDIVTQLFEVVKSMVDLICYLREYRL